MLAQGGCCLLEQICSLPAVFNSSVLMAYDGQPAKVKLDAAHGRRGNLQRRLGPELLCGLCRREGLIDLVLRACLWNCKPFRTANVNHDAARSSLQGIVPGRRNAGRKQTGGAGATGTATCTSKSVVSLTGDITFNVFPLLDVLHCPPI